MAHQPDNNRFQPLSLYTRSPVRMDYNRILPPLADQPLLELRRPANKDACFAISALSPTMSKRFGGDWDSMSGRTSLLDRYLGQQALSPIAPDSMQSPVETGSQLPVTPVLTNVPANPKALWALMSTRRSQHQTELKISQVPTLVTQPTQRPPERRLSQGPRETAAQRRRRERGPPPAGTAPNILRKPERPTRELDHMFVSRLEGFPIPRVSPAPLVSPAPRASPASRASPPPQANPASRASPRYGSGPPSTGSGRSVSTTSLASALEELGTVPTASRVDSWIGPPISTQQPVSTRGRDAPRYPGLPPAPNAKLKNYVPKIKTVRFAGSKSNASSLKSPTVYEYDCDRSWPSPSPTSFSPVTPVAMTFEYPLILDNTPELDQVPWDDEAELMHDSPHESVMTIVSDKAVIHSPDRGRLFNMDKGHSPRSRARARSHSPPKSAFPSDSPVQFLPPAIYDSGQNIKAPDRNRQRTEPKDDFDLNYDVAQELKDGAGSLDRTALWVLCGTTKSTVERKQVGSTGSKGNDREAILQSYFNRC